MRILQDNLVIGVKWSQHGSRQAAMQAIKGLRDIKFVGRKAEGKEYVVGVVSDEGGVFSKSVYAAALVVASIEPTAVVFYPVGEDEIWLCGVNRGLPMPGYDQVCSTRVAIGLLAEIRGFTEDVVIIGDFPGAAQSFEQFIERANPKALRPARLVAPEFRLYLGLIALGFMVLIGCVYGGLRYWKSRVDAENVASSAQVLAAQQQARTLRLKEQFTAEVAKQRSTALHTVSPIAQFNAWREIIRALPVSVEGWRPEKVDCNLERCEVSWRPSNGALPSVALRLPGVTAPSANGTQATSTFALPTLAPAAYSDADIDLTTYLNDYVPRIKFGTLTVNPPVIDVLPVIAPELSAVGGTPPAIAREGGFVLTSGSGIATAVFMGKLNYPGVSLKSLRLDGVSTTGATWVVEGNYRVVQ